VAVKRHFLRQGIRDEGVLALLDSNKPTVRAVPEKICIHAYSKEVKFTCTQVM
jgi:hypothetical protein